MKNISPITAIALICFLIVWFLVFRYWEKLAKKEAKEDGYPKAGKGKVISLDDSEDFY